jgi:hypothetical protein
MNKTHGSPYDRGHADAWYGRSARPHKWLDGIGVNEVTCLTTEETAEYKAGYDACINEGNFAAKEWE